MRRRRFFSLLLPAFVAACSGPSRHAEPSPHGRTAPPEAAGVTAAPAGAAVEGAGAAHREMRPLEEGAPAPDFSLPDAHGAFHSLAQLRSDGPVVVAFYQGAWCTSCREQLEQYQAHLGAIAAAGGRLVAISADPPEKSARLGETLQLTYPLLSDVRLEVAAAYGVVQAVGGLPLAAVFIVDRDGVVRWRRVGESIPEAQILEALRQLSAPTAPPPDVDTRGPVH